MVWTRKQPSLGFDMASRYEAGCQPIPGRDRDIQRCSGRGRHRGWEIGRERKKEGEGRKKEKWEAGRKEAILSPMSFLWGGKSSSGSCLPPSLEIQRLISTRGQLG